MTTVTFARLAGLLAAVRTSARVLGVCCVAAAAVAGHALAQQEPDPLQAQVAATATFDIPAQPLASALTTLGRQAGLQVVFDPASVSGKSAPGVAGTMRVEQALRQLLAGTGMTFRASSPSSITVMSPPSSGALQLDPVRVQGAFPVPSQAMIDNAPPPYAGGQVATGGQLGLLGNRPVMDTPFNQTSFTAKKAQDQQAKTVKDVLIDDPSVRTLRTDGSFGPDSFKIRGFEVSNQNNLSYGGLYGILPNTSVMAELAERVEVLKGPTALLNGMSPGNAIGGTINLVPKRAPDEGLMRVAANYVSASQFGGHVDLAHRFGPDKEIGVRLNGVFKAGQTPVDYNTDQRALALLGLDFRGDAIRLSADLGYQSQYIGGIIPYIGLGAGVPLPWAPNARTNQGQPWSYQQRKDLFGVVRAEVDLTERVTAYAAFGAHDNRNGGIDSSDVTVTDFNGAAVTSRTGNLSQYTTYLTGEAGIRALVDTGPIGHEVAVTATTFNAATGFGRVRGVANATNIYDPTIIQQPNLPFPAAPRILTQGLTSLGFADTLTAADKRIQLTAGLRLQNVTSQNYDATTGRPTTGYDQSALSPAVALVFKPWENVTVYGNYIQGLQQGTVVGSNFANAGEIFPPFKSTQYEAGVKFDWGRFTTTASVFQIAQPSLITILGPGPSLPTLVLNGEQRNQGLEINVFGEPTEGVRMLGGVMFLNPVLAKTQGGLNDGWIAPLTPQLNINLYGEWDLPFVPGLTLNGRVIYTSSQHIDTSWPRRSLPDWTRFDIGARYAFENPGAKGKLLVARFNIENVLDANYWEGGAAPNQLFLGMPRTFRLSLTADF